MVLDKLTTAERFAVCYQVAKEADMLEYVLFKNSLDVSGMEEWYSAAAAKWNSAHTDAQITAEDVKSSMRYECCTSNTTTLQAHIDDGVNLTSVGISITADNKDRMKNSFIPWCVKNNVAVRVNTGEGLGTNAGIDSQLDWAELVELGCTEIMTDHPGELITYLQTVINKRIATENIEAEHFTSYNYDTASFTVPLDYDSTLNKCVENMGSGDYLVYKNITFDGTESMLSVLANGQGTTLSLYLDSMDPEDLIAAVPLSSTSYDHVLAFVDNPIAGNHTLYVVSNGVASVDSYRFSNSLYFGFDNSEAALRRYDNPVYSGINFDTGGWISRSATMSALSFNTAEGTISAELAAGGNHYIQTGSAASSLPLRYQPQEGDILQMRLRIDGATAYNPNNHLSVGLVFSGNGCGDFDYNERVVTGISSSDIDSGYSTLTLPLNTAFTNANEIRALRLYFTNFASKDGATAGFTVDYVYIGPQRNLPQQDNLFLILKIRWQIRSATAPTPMEIPILTQEIGLPEAQP